MSGVNGKALVSPVRELATSAKLVGVKSVERSALHSIERLRRESEFHRIRWKIPTLPAKAFAVTHHGFGVIRLSGNLDNASQ
jgi:hypothetical protein